MSISQQPRPIVMDSNLKFLELPAESIRLVNPVICTCIGPQDTKWVAAIRKLKEIGGGDIIYCKRGSDGRCDIRDSLLRLKSDLDINSILVEGGANIIQSILEHQLVHQIVMTIKSSFLGGYRSLTDQLSRLTNLIDVTVEVIEGDIILHGCVSTETCHVDNLLEKNAFDNENQYDNGSSDINACGYGSTYNQQARDIVEEWKKYAEKSENMYKKLYPHPPSETS